MVAPLTPIILVSQSSYSQYSTLASAKPGVAQRGQHRDSIREIETYSLPNEPHYYYPRLDEFEKHRITLSVRVFRYASKFNLLFVPEGYVGYDRSVYVIRKA